MAKRLGERLYQYLRLMRFPNLFTAAADVLAGAFIATGTSQEWQGLALILTASVCFYGGGCVLNDLCDVGIDGRERPFRPIPSGKVSRREALVLACFLFAAGLLSARRAGVIPFLFALLLVQLIIAYNLFAKERPLLGPLVMGGCRAVNLSLGMGAALFTFVFTSSVPALFPLITLAYVFSLTRLSRFETGGAPARSRAVGRTVRALIVAIPLLDALYVACAREGLLALPVALCAVPARFFGRYFYST